MKVRSRMLRLIAVLLLSLALPAADPPTLQPGSLPPQWQTGGPNCLTVPDWQVHEYNDDFYILRESGCINYEKPFLFLIIGQDKALLEDTGAGPVQTGPFVMGLLEKWAKKKNRPVPSLIVIHSHGHGDHMAGDKQFQNMPNVQFIAATPEEIQKAASISSWPTQSGTLDLGGRVVDVLPIPGHHNASIALYDRRTGILLTGDSLYPGRLYVPDGEFPTFAASAARLADFVRIHPVAHVLGTHIEQSRTAYVDYPTGTLHQPNEHALELSRAHVLELDEGFRSLNGKPGTVALPEFTIMPRPVRMNRPQKKN